MCQAIYQKRTQTYQAQQTQAIT